jgi:hypothetical protein
MNPAHARQGDTGWHVPANAPFVTDQRRPAGLDPATLSRFGDDVWRFTPLTAGHHQEKSVTFTTFSPPLRESWRRLAWVFINLPTPTELLDRAFSNRVRWPSPGSIHTMMSHLRRFDRWLAQRGVTALDQVDADVLTDYAGHVAGLKLSVSISTGALYTVSRVWGAAPHLPPADRIATPPWEITSIKDYLPGIVPHSNENSTVPIHPAVMSPLLIWSLRFVDDFAADIIAAWREYQRVCARVRPQRNPQATAALTVLLDQSQLHGVALPGAPLGGGRRGVAARFLAGLHATSSDHVRYLVSRRTGLTISDHAALATPITGLLHGRPWRAHIDFFEAAVLMRLLSTACLVVVAYLSGLRPAEVLNLRAGCCPPPADEGTSPRHQLHGNFFKAARGEGGQILRGGATRATPWTTIEPVAHAIAVLERIATTPLLFAAHEPWNPTRAGGARAEAIVTPEAVTTRISDLIAWVNSYATRHDLPTETIPTDPAGTATLSRFRRTIAWHIARLPRGRIALAIQYGHLRAIHSDGYSARSREGLRRVIDVESALNIAEFLQDLADRLDAGEGVSGPAATRMIKSVRERTTRFEGMFLADRDLKALLDEPQFQVFDNPDAFLTCNKDPDKALCDPERGNRTAQRHTAPALDRCDPACANIARTDTHIQAARDEIKHLEAEIADPLTPIPLAARLRQRTQTLQAIVDRHDRTRIVVPVEAVKGRTGG